MSEEGQVHDPLPSMLAELAQGVQLMIETSDARARVTKALYDGYKEAGFSESQALYLAGSYWQTPKTPEEE